jgi:excisionase family DNA binding protein
MKAELNIETQELAKEIVERLFERIKPFLSANGSREAKDVLLTPDELAQLLKVKKSQIYALVNESKYSDDGIPFLKAGKFLRFPQREIFEWMKSIKIR